MSTEFIEIQSGNLIAANRVVAMMTPKSAPARRLIEEYKSKGLLLDMTNGGPRAAFILMDTGHAVLAAVAPETVAKRLAVQRRGHPDHVGEST